MLKANWCNDNNNKEYVIGPYIFIRKYMFISFCDKLKLKQKEICFKRASKKLQHMHVITKLNIMQLDKSFKARKTNHNRHRYCQEAHLVFCFKFSF